MDHQIKELPEIKLIGRAFKIKHSDMNAETWEKYWTDFFKDQVEEKIPNKVNKALYGAYLNFEGQGDDMSYTFLIACEVENLDEIPEGLESHTLKPSKYAVFSDTGEISEVVAKLWKKAWEAEGLERKMDAAFEYYGEDVQNPNNAKVSVYIGVK